MRSPVWLAATAALLFITVAAPYPQADWFSPTKLDPLKHLSAISPFYVPSRKPDALPKGCSLVRASVLIRHSSILGNDDEYEQSMGPIIDKIGAADKADLPTTGAWAFLVNWTSPIVPEHLEELSTKGSDDAEHLGRYLRHQYGKLFPPPDAYGARSGHTARSKPPYKVWTASSARDIDSAKAFIKGAFPRHQSGEDGHGDGKVVQLIKVPNKSRDWDRSLTPHKACDAFEKDSSLGPANEWLAVYAARVRDRLQPHMPRFVDQLIDQDILGMQMLCGYESIAQGSSHFCDVFTDDEWLDFEYHQDIRFHYMLGYGQNLSPYLGMPWVKTAAHLLDGQDSGDDDDHDSSAVMRPLPKPRLPPNATHTQMLHASFTHRESPGFVAVFLNLFNASSYDTPASVPPPLTHRPVDRAWRTSHLIPFLGHVALERFRAASSTSATPLVVQRVSRPDTTGMTDEYQPASEAQSKRDFVRAMVNGKHEVMGGCEDGIEGSCRWETFLAWVEQRAESWGDWESVCDI